MFNATAPRQPDEHHRLPVCINNVLSVYLLLCSVGTGAIHFTERHSAPGHHTADTKARAINQGLLGAAQHLRQHQPASNHLVKPSKASAQVNHGYSPYLMTFSLQCMQACCCCGAGLQTFWHQVTALPGTYTFHDKATYWKNKV